MMTLDTRIELTDEGRTAVAETETPSEAPTFQIDTECRANWLLRKLANLDAEKARVKAQAETITKQLDTDREGLLYLYGSQLEAFTRQELEKQGSRRKSLTLLQGTCFFRSVSATVKVSDHAALLAFAEANGRADLLTIKTTVDTTAARKYTEETGDLLPGMEKVPAREAFSVRFSGKEASE